MTHPDLAALAFLVGTWRGRGHGDYPTIDPFDYDEEVVITAMPKPVLAYRQQTRHARTDAPLHAESGWIRLDGGAPELVISQPTGIVEAHAGQLDGTRVTWDSVSVGATPAAAVHRVTAVRRDLRVDGDELTYELWMAAAGQPLQVHLRATLLRDVG